MEQGQIEPVQVADFLRHVRADEGGGGSVQRVQPVGQFDEAHKVGSDRGTRTSRVVVEDLDGGRPRVKVHVVVAIVHHRLAAGIVEVKRRGGRLDRSAGQAGRDARYLRLQVHLRAVPGQKVQCAAGVDAHAGVTQQVVGLGHDALDGLGGQDLQTGAFGHVDSWC